MASIETVQAFVEWLKASGGQFNDSLSFEIDDKTGLSVTAMKDIKKGETYISVPASLAITAEKGKEAIRRIYGDEALSSVEGWTERMLVSAYLILHWTITTKTKINGPGDKNRVLEHQAYIDVLPSRDTLLTPLFWTEEERALLVGTNLHGTIADQEKERQGEYERIRKVIEDSTLEDYYAATAYISSRAFPSRLLSVPEDTTAGNSNGKEEKRSEAEGEKTDEDGSYPVLIPGLDLFNHARGTPITWLSSRIPSSSSSSTSTSIPCVSFISEKDVPASQEVYNNYGPKSNEELLLSYGFVLPDNPDDTLVLRLGGPDQLAEELASQGMDLRQRFVMRKDGVVPQALLKVMRSMIGGHLPLTTKAHEHGPGCNHDHDDGDEQEEEEEEEEDEHEAHEREMEELQLELDVLGTLGGMLEDKLEKINVDLSLEPSSSTKGKVRDSVRGMVEVYRKGQVDILMKTLDTLGERVERLEGMMDQGMGGCPCGC